MSSDHWDIRERTLIAVAVESIVEELEQATLELQNLQSADLPEVPAMLVSIMVLNRQLCALLKRVRLGHRTPLPEPAPPPPPPAPA